VSITLKDLERDLAHYEMVIKALLKEVEYLTRALESMLSKRDYTKGTSKVVEELVTKVLHLGEYIMAYRLLLYQKRRLEAYKKYKS